MTTFSAEQKRRYLRWLSLSAERLQQLGIFSALIIVALLFAGNLSAANSAGSVPVQLKCESMSEPMGIDVTSPRLSWQLQDNRRGAAQTAYQIRVATSPAQLKQGSSLVWDSGRVASSESVNVVYGGPAVASRQRYYWQVRAWDQDGKVGVYSAPSWWEM